VREEGVKKRNDNVKIGNMDYVLLFTIVVLSLIGVAMVFSSSYYTAGISSKFSNDMYYFLKKEVVFVILGYIVIAIVSRIPYQNYQNWSRVIYTVSVVLCFAVIVIGTVSNGAARWLFGLQPSELAKIGMVLVLSDFIARHKHILDTWGGFALSLAIVLIPIGLVGKENLSTALIMTVVSGGILFVASPRIRYFVVMALGVVFVVLLVLKFGDGFRGDRFAAWKDPESASLGTGYQILQGLYAVGSGGMFGVGLGQSRQKLGFIPESHNDIIFAVICEELGAFGAAIIVLLYMIMIWRCIRIAMNATSMYGTLISTGMAVMVGAQVFINISVVTNTIPNTGIPLPFISYGGTSMLTLMIGMAIVLNISRHYKE
jgi:cell division protein FtsW